MKLKQTFFLPGAVLVVSMASSGCSGINHTQGVSPATFFMPGMGQTTPKKDQAPFTPETLPHEHAEPAMLVRAN